jgi:hypothetical protein
MSPDPVLPPHPARAAIETAQTVRGKVARKTLDMIPPW